MIDMILNLAMFIYNLIWMSVILDSKADIVGFIIFIIFAILAIWCLIEAILSGVEYKIKKMKKDEEKAKERERQIEKWL